jgi:hypothetical protein
MRGLTGQSWLEVKIGCRRSGHAHSTERSASPFVGRAKGSGLSTEKPERDLTLNSFAQIKERNFPIRL